MRFEYEDGAIEVVRLSDISEEYPPNGMTYHEYMDHLNGTLPALWERRSGFRLPLWEDIGIANKTGPHAIKSAFAYYEQMQGEPIGRIIDRYGDWFVTDFGIECPSPIYFIENARINEPDWFIHMCEKAWVVPEHFGCALFFARRRLANRNEREIGKRLRFSVLKRDGYKCQICGASAEHGAQLEVDHKVPISKGGKSVKGNLWTLCYDCNRGKGTSELN